MYAPPKSQLEQSAVPVLDGFFNILVVISIVLTIAIWGLPYVQPFYLSDQDFNLLSYAGYGAILPSNNFIYWGLFIFWLIVGVGLIMRSSLMRTIYLCGIVVTVLLSFFWGFSVATPLESVVFSVINMIDGALITMAYLTSVSRSFTQ